MAQFPADEPAPFDVGFIDRELVHLDREEGLFRVWRFILHLLEGNHPAGLIFLCGAAEHYPEFFAERLGRNGGVDVYGFFDRFPELKPEILPTWTSRVSELLSTEKKRPFLAKAVLESIKLGINGFDEGSYNNLAEIYSGIKVEDGRRLFFFPLRIDAKTGPSFLPTYPPKLIIEEFDEFANQVAAGNDSEPPPLFLFCVMVNGMECGSISAAFEEDDLSEEKIVVTSNPDISVTEGYKRSFPISGKQNYWGISSWEEIKYTEVATFLSDMTPDTDPKKQEQVRSLIMDLKDAFGERDCLSLQDTRRLIKDTIQKRP